MWLLWLFGCVADVEDTDEPDTTYEVPPRLDAEGSAASPEVAPYPHVRCSFRMTVEDVEEMDGGWQGVVTEGEVVREIFDEGGEGGELSVPVEGPATLTLTPTGIDARLVGDHPADAAPFWRALEVISAEPVDLWFFAGDWTCAPTDADLGGIPDDTVRVEGSWRIARPG